MPLNVLFTSAIHLSNIFAPLSTSSDLSCLSPQYEVNTCTNSSKIDFRTYHTGVVPKPFINVECCNFKSKHFSSFRITDNYFFDNFQIYLPNLSLFINHFNWISKDTLFRQNKGTCKVFRPTTNSILCINETKLRVCVSGREESRRPSKGVTMDLKGRHS